MTTQTVEALPPAFEDVASLSVAITASQPQDMDDPLTAIIGDAQSFSEATTWATSEIQGAEDEEQLPDYEPEAVEAQLPGYAERHLLEPVVSYNVYQINRRLQVLTPATRATFDRPRYRVNGRLGPSLFSKKADYTLTRLPTGATAATENSPGEDVGFTSFDRAGQLPWMPRATVSMVQGRCNAGKMVVYDLQSPNFSDWKFMFNEQVYYWRLTHTPTALSLMEHSSNSVIARFTYSTHGTDASRGADVGTLNVFGGYGSGSMEAVELVLSTWVVPLNHWKNMGRHYKNSVTPRNYSVFGPINMGNSFFARDGSGPESRRASNAA